MNVGGANQASGIAGNLHGPLCSDLTLSLRALTELHIAKRVALGMTVQMWSQLCGINIM